MSICQQYNKIPLSKYTSIFLPHHNLCLYIGTLLNKQKKENFPAVWGGLRIWFTYPKNQETTGIQRSRKKCNQILTGYGKSYFKWPPTWYSRSTQQGFPLAVEKARTASLCRTPRPTCPCSQLHAQATHTYSTYTNCYASSKVWGWSKETETGKGEMDWRKSVDGFPSANMTDAFQCSVLPRALL